MALLPSDEWSVAEAIAGIGYANPFLAERVELERRALGPRYIEVGPIIRSRPGEGLERNFENVPALIERAGLLATEIGHRLGAGRPATPAELLVYEDLALYLLYGRYLAEFDDLVSKSLHEEGGQEQVRFWTAFSDDFQRLFRAHGRQLPSRHDPKVVFAGCFQIQRAFTQIYHRIVGGSMPAARLRASVWESIFTRDMRRYIRSLHRTMADVPTLITGPSGSGKELVAGAIGLSCVIPFDPGSRRFLAREAETYIPLNLSALAPTLIESELFGHVKGAFTTAHKDRAGWLERCGEHGAVFLDEIGELDPAIQVKLLRVIETRRFQKVGSTDTLPFKGKIIAATNRDLAAEMHAGRFRHDLYYRLCADQVATPSLAEQLADRPEDLPELVRFIAREVLVKRTDDPIGPQTDDGFTEEVEPLTAEVVGWIDRELGRDYAWPGNFRELGQCVRNVMIRGSYRPALPQRDRAGGLGPVEELLRQVRGVEITADELLGRYYALAYDRSDKSFSEAGRRLDVDWRVLKRRLDQAFLERLRSSRTSTCNPGIRGQGQHP
jgi:DNA-binding NtrC family response regulator